jgi:hypothetical protein
MLPIALIDTRTEIPEETLGSVISIHATMLDAFRGNDEFQRASGSSRHIRTKIVTLKETLLPAHKSGRRNWPATPPASHKYGIPRSRPPSAIGGEDTIRTLKHAKQPQRSHVHGCEGAEIHLDRGSAMCPSGIRRLD